ncbi:MAG: glycoside hydrolase family 3 C-terminal domain-containing protein, partial [Bacteroidales bacterium]|nr:glycoside hydrolase family 3 C-terminal domain-containing protein [Bacteroidales bacterium]
ISIAFKTLNDNAKFNAIRVLNSQGEAVACVKACDLMATADASALKIPTVLTAAIYNNPDKPMDQRIDDLIRRMSLAEKVSQLVNAAPAIPRLNVPAYNYWSECLHGVARNGHATVFPQAIALAAAWDENLVHQIGEVIATEARAKFYEANRIGEGGKENRGLNFWAPNVNIFRDPRWGRGHETYGEDPYLTSRIGVGFITGIQGNDPNAKYLKAMACAKHFAVHSGPEQGRAGFNVDPDARDLYETYLPQFEACVKEAHVGSVMSAYNAVNKIPSSCNPWLLTDLLRKTWGFKGHVVSDCGAVGNITGAHHYSTTGEQGSAFALKAGLDLECGGSFRNLTKSVAQGLVTEKDIDTALHRVLKIRFQFGLFDPADKAPFANIPMSEVESPAHLALACSTARASMVLLKNNNVLPLDKKKIRRIAVIGANAASNGVLNGNYHGVPTKPVNILNGIKAEAGETVAVDYAMGCPLVLKTGMTSPEGTPDYQKAIDMAKSADVVIYVGGLDAGLEGEESNLICPGFNKGDRTWIELPDVQARMLRALQATGKPVVFVNCTGSAIAMPWEAANLAAILQAWYPGGEGGTAVADILFGKYNPAGRLPVTFYEKTSDLPDFNDYRMANRTYRYFKGKPLFPFGYGLSYTTFQYQPVRLKVAKTNVTGAIQLTVPLKNTGNRDGDEVVQVYVRHKNSPVPQPIRSLVAFKRVSVVKGATVLVDFKIPADRFRYWSVEKKKYVVDPGQYDLQIGASSSDIRQSCNVDVVKM